MYIHVQSTVYWLLFQAVEKAMSTRRGGQAKKPVAAAGLEVTLDAILEEEDEVIHRDIIYLRLTCDSINPNTV